MEGVDRNIKNNVLKLRTVKVALLMEGVDRNCISDVQRPNLTQSPSSWRAWIEIYRTTGHRQSERVALLMEGVDRNVSVWLVCTT